MTKETIIEEIIEDVYGKMHQAILDDDMMRANLLGNIIDWLKQEKNK